MANEKGMNPVSGERVETSGVYQTEWGREELLKEGEIFPSDVAMGDATWKLVGLPSDEELEKLSKRGDGNDGPRFHPHRGDR